MKRLTEIFTIKEGIPIKDEEEWRDMYKTLQPHERSSIIHANRATAGYGQKQDPSNFALMVGSGHLYNLWRKENPSTTKQEYDKFFDTAVSANRSHFQQKKELLDKIKTVQSYSDWQQILDDKFGPPVPYGQE